MFSNDINPHLSKTGLFFSCLAALIMTLLTMLLLPALESIPQKQQSELQQLQITTAALEPPVKEMDIPKQQIEEPPPKPENNVPRPTLKQELAVPVPASPKPPSLPIKFDFNVPIPSPDLQLNFKVDTLAINIPQETQTTAPQLNTQTPLSVDGVIDFDNLDARPKIISQPSPVYPYRALAKGISGKVTVEFIVLPNGNTDELSVIHSEPEKLFDKAAIQAIQKWKFSPGKKNGKIVPVRTRIHVVFNLIP